MLDDSGGDGLRIVVDDCSGEPRTDQHAEAIGDEGDEPLGGGAQAGGGLAVDVDLAGDEEEVVADAVEQDSAPQHTHQVAGAAEGEEQITCDPGQHRYCQHVLDAEAAEEPGDEEHEEHLGHLASGHLAGGVLDVLLVEEEVGEGVVEL